MNADIFDNVEEAMYVSLQTNTYASAYFNGTCDYSGTTETDAVWLTRNLSGGDRGLTFCQAKHLNGHCDQYYLALDLAELAEGSNDELDETKTACHELGHSVGLTHHGSGYRCMISGERPDTDVKWSRFQKEHHIDDHINKWFE